MSRICLLFDLDLTLMNSDGAGGAAMARAFEAETGAAGSLAGIAINGRTDRWIVAEVARRSGTPFAPLWRRYKHDYPELLREELGRRRPRALPGVAALLATLAPRADVTLALATGNDRAPAFIKLARVGLDRYFTLGAFGDRHEDRAEMLRDAVAAVGWRAGERLVVIGDTEHDVSAARAVGALALAVATGSRSVEELEAAGADYVLPDLGDLERALAATLG